ncbi:MAG: hypothetical protein ACRDD8_15835 [Bacteroidales bacterium]
MCYGRSCAGCYHSGSCDTQDSIEYDEDNPYKSNDTNDKNGHWGSYDSEESDDDGWGGGSSW